MDGAASELEYYINSRLEIESILSKEKYKPKRWTNYRPLWYKYYANEELPDNSFGQQEKVKMLKK